MLSDVVDLLICPHCGAGLRLEGRVVSCARGHCYDVARQGYVNLLPGGAHTGTADTAAMVAARETFLAGGHFAPLIDALVAHAARLARPDPPGCVVDLGAGPGRYLAAVLDRLPGAAGLALDLSKHAARRAARVHPRIGAVVCDVWRPLPVRSGVAALVLDVFAPRNGAQIARVLRPGGALLVVTPAADHLAELVGPLGLLSVDEDKPGRLRRQLAPHLRPESETSVTFDMALPGDAVAAVVAMGPSAWHVARERIDRRVRELGDPLQVTAAVTVAVYRT